MLTLSSSSPATLLAT